MIEYVDRSVAFRYPSATSFPGRSTIKACRLRALLSNERSTSQSARGTKPGSAGLDSMLQASSTFWGAPQDGGAAAAWLASAPKSVRATRVGNKRIRRADSVDRCILAIALSTDRKKSDPALGRPANGAKRPGRHLGAGELPTHRSGQGRGRGADQCPVHLLQRERGTWKRASNNERLLTNPQS
jgi:hypothetical protein